MKCLSEHHGVKRVLFKNTQEEKQHVKIESDRPEILERS